MKIYDLSPEISEEMDVYKNRLEKRPKITVTRTLKEGANESKLDIFVHTGSHVDAPYHVLKNGETIDNVDLHKFMGKCIVLDLTKTKSTKIKDFLDTENPKDFPVNSITKNDLIKSKLNIQKDDIVLLKTKNKADKKFNFNFTYLEKTGAEYLVSKRVKAVGIDNLGIERSQPNHETHKILLSKNILIFEGLDLSKVKQGKYFFHGLPLKIRKGDGSPVRAILVER